MSKKVNLDRPYGYVYLVINSINGKYYIGKHKYSTTNPVTEDECPKEMLEAYYNSHGHHMFKFDPNYKGSGKLIKQAFEKYGWENFYIEDILDIACDEDDLSRKEKDLIMYCKAHRPDMHLYNISDGGQGGNIVRCLPPDRYEEVCNKRREIGKRCRNILFSDMKGPNNPMYGKKHTEEAKQKNREAHLGKKS